MPGASAGASIDDRLPALVDALAEALLDGRQDDHGHAAALRDRLAVLRRLEGLLAVATARTVRSLEQSGAVKADGASSTTAWIAEATGVSRKQASVIGRRASSLSELPNTTRELVDGRVSAATADEVILAARDGRLGTPAEVEFALLPLAQDERPEQVRAEVRRRTHQADGTAMALDERRQRRRPDQRLADTFATAVDVALDHGDLPVTGGVRRPHLSVVVDVATFETDLTNEDGTGPIAPSDPRWAGLPPGETAWGSALSPQAVRQLCCDAAVSRVVMAGPSQVLDVGRATRDWTAAQRRAINARDRSCRGPGCRRPIAWTQIHHIRWWRHGGPTDVGNGVALCSACHTLVHRDGWHLDLDPATATVTWRSPDRRRTVITHPRPPD